MKSKGILIYAHNNELIDYIKLATVSSQLATQHLKLPVSLVTDTPSLNNTSVLDIKDHFEQIILVDLPSNANKRIVNNTVCSFLNSNRSSAWDLTPYDQTLLIDADYFIFTDKLNQYWNIDQSFLISSGVDYFVEEYLGTGDRYIDETSIPMRWATTLMFTKNQESKLLFDLVSFIKENQQYYSNLYGFDTRMFRNDIAFSIACHTLNGQLNTDTYMLPKVKTIRSQSKILNLKKNSVVKAVLTESQPIIIESTNSDVHFLNKLDLLTHLGNFQ
jgi:hypothetical protein